MKKLGIIGGLGPDSTAIFYLKFNKLAQEVGMRHRPACVIWNTPIDRTLEEDLLSGNDVVFDYLPYLKEGLKDLEAAGCDYVAIPCNTVHVLADDLVQSTKLPLINIVDQTIVRLKVEFVSEVLILATGQTIKSQLYQKKLEEAGIKFVIPAASDQVEVDKLIEGAVNFSFGSSAKSRFQGVVSNYEPRDIVLGCTELSMLREHGDQKSYFDSTQILAEACVERIKGGKDEN